MTDKEIAARKFRMFLTLGIGIAALIASYAIGYVGQKNSVSTMTEILLTAIFLACIFVSATIAFKLNKEKAQFQSQLTEYETTGAIAGHPID